MEGVELGGSVYLGHRTLDIPRGVLVYGVLRMKPALPTLGINLVGWGIDSRGLPGGVGGWSWPCRRVQPPIT